MQKVKDLLHVNKDKDSRSHLQTTSAGSGTSERSVGGTAGGVAGQGSNYGGNKSSGITGVGAGASPALAKHAADEAARQDREVAVKGPSGVATGQPQHGKSVTGVGAGNNPASAKVAANEAANQRKDVAVDTQAGVARGKPVGQAGGQTTATQTTGATQKAVADTTAASGAHKEGEVIDRKYYTGKDVRPQDQQIVEQFREHNPYAKEYETTVQHTGRERQVGAEVEHLGTDVRVVGQDDHFGNPHHHLTRHVPEGAVNERPGGEGWVQKKAGPVCDSTNFSVDGNRPVVKERVTNLRQHNEFEKEFEVATKYKGERAGGPAAPELLNRDHKVIGEKDKVACEGHPTVSSKNVGSKNVGGDLQP